MDCYLTLVSSWTLLTVIVNKAIEIRMSTVAGTELTGADFFGAVIIITGNVFFFKQKTAYEM